MLQAELTLKLTGFFSKLSPIRVMDGEVKMFEELYEFKDLSTVIEKFL